jgi:hypothetical protein
MSGFTAWDDQGITTYRAMKSAARQVPFSDENSVVSCVVDSDGPGRQLRRRCAARYADRWTPRGGDFRRCGKWRAYTTGSAWSDPARGFDPDEASSLCVSGPRAGIIHHRDTEDTETIYWRRQSSPSYSGIRLCKLRSSLFGIKPFLCDLPASMVSQNFSFGARGFWQLAKRAGDVLDAGHDRSAALADEVFDLEVDG